MSWSTIRAYEFHHRLLDAEAARKYLEAGRWDGVSVYLTYHSSEPTYKLLIVGDHRCPASALDFTVRMGTIMERSHILLDNWLYAFCLVVAFCMGPMANGPHLDA